MSVAEIVVTLAGLYLAIGAVFAVSFAAGGMVLVDPATHAAPLGFRLLILPGAAALWPLLSARCLRALRRRSQT